MTRFGGFPYPATDVDYFTDETTGAKTMTDPYTTGLIKRRALEDAAPKMLEALKALVAWDDTPDKPTDRTEKFYDLQRAMNRARAAIAEAEGKLEEQRQ